MHSTTKRSPFPPFPWKIGDLAKHTGITVKALRHYDEINLLKPSATGANGYRLYEQRDLERLQQILSFKHLGLPLEEIKAALTRPDYSPQDVLQRQFLQMREQLQSQQELVERLDGMLRLMQARKAMHSKR